MEDINVSLEPLNYTEAMVIWNTGKENMHPMNNLTNEAWKVNTQDQCNKIIGLSESDRFHISITGISTF